MMKLKSVVLLSVLSLFLAGCATTQESAQQVPRFSEGRHANVVLRFSSWDYTFMSKPFHAEGGFMQQVRPETFGSVLNRYQVDRNMAVVVVGWQYNGAQLDEVVSGWKQALSGCGFQRVVFLRATKTSELNGAIIVEDTRFPIRTAQAGS